MSGIGRDMLNLPGNFVRGAGSFAGNIVGGTVNAMTSVATATGVVPRRLSIDGTPVVLRDKLTLTIKSTPERTAACMGTLALKSGSLLKRNEQGVWQKRYACLVPHFFLYYFDGDSSKEPQGVIDLEFCTDITVQTDNIIKICAGELYEGRTFYFQADNAVESNAWASSMQRERYGVVKDERDAYQSLQDQFSSQLDSAFQMVEVASQEKEKLQSDVQTLKKKLEDAVFYIKKLAMLAGVSDEDVKDSSNVQSIGEAVVQATEQLKASFASQSAYEIEMRKQEHEDLHDKIEKLERELSAEIHNRRLMEAQFTSEKRDAELRLRDADVEVEKATALVESMQTERREFDTKTNELLEQKRVLVKEVKSLRKRIHQLEESSTQLSQLNLDLSSNAAQLKDMVETLQQKQKIENEEALAAAVLVTSQLLKESENITTDPSARENSAEAKTSAKTQQSSAPEFPWEKNRSTLQNIDWLAPEQRSLLREHGEGETPQPPPIPYVEAKRPESTRVLAPTSSASLSAEKAPGATTVASVEAPSKSNNAAGSVHAADNKTPHSDSVTDMLISKFVPSMNLSSMFHKDKEKEAPKDVPPKDTSSKEESSSSGIHFKSFFSPSSSSSGGGGLFSISSSSHAGAVIDSDRAEQPTEPTVSSVVHVSSPNVPRCYRCGGTVEGPKYSTCKCAIPAMSPIEISPGEGSDPSASTATEQNRRGSMSSFMGMLSRGMKTVTPSSTSSPGHFHAALQLESEDTAAVSSSSRGHVFLEIENAEVDSIKGSNDVNKVEQRGDINGEKMAAVLAEDLKILDESSSIGIKSDSFMFVAAPPATPGGMSDDMTPTDTSELHADI